MSEEPTISSDFDGSVPESERRTINTSRGGRVIIDDRTPSHVVHLPTPMPGQIGHYTIISLIASGGMGSVYQARQESPSRVVALKVMKNTISSPLARRRFEYESELLGRMHHPGLAQVYEAGTFGDAKNAQPFYAMEYLPNARSITTYANDKQLSVSERLQLFLKVCDAVGYVHNRGIIHRDLKPDNVLVDESGEPKLIDFGIARPMNADETFTTQHPSAKRIIGALQYMSPEQVDERIGDLDTRCDVYALGVILYELICGDVPYRVSRENLPDAIRTIVETGPRRPRLLCRDIHADLEAIILKALRKDRDERYKSVDRLRDDIEDQLNDRPLRHARRHTIGYLLWYHARRTIRQRRGLAYLLVIAMVFLLIEFIGVLAIYRWAPIHTAYEVWLTSAFGQVNTDQPFKHVRALPVREKSLAGMSDLADKLGIKGGDPDSPGTWRGLHGKLLQRLAEAGVDVPAVGFDIAFRRSNEYEGPLIEGIKAMRSAGARVVLVNPTWGDEPIVSEGFIDLVDYAPATASVIQGPAWAPDLVRGGLPQIDLLTQRGEGRVIPGFALSMAYAAIYDDAVLFPQFFVDQWEGTVTMTGLYTHNRSYLPSTDQTTLKFSAMKIMNERDIAADRAKEYSDFESPDYFEEKDYIARYSVIVPSDAAIEASTIEWIDVFGMSDEDLRQAMDGRIILISNPGGDGVMYVQDRYVNNPDVVAGAIEAIIDGQTVFEERESYARLTLIIAAALGVFAGAVSRRRLIAPVVCIPVVASILLIMSIILFERADYIFNPITPLLGFLVALALAMCIRPQLAHTKLQESYEPIT